jgi:predicted aspartyl protease
MAIRSFGAVLIFALLAASRTGDAETTPSNDLPDADTLQARVEAAAGKPLPRERITTDYTEGSVSGTSVEYRIDKNERTLEMFGPFHIESGKYDGQKWDQNRNGETLLEQPDPGLATSDTLRTSVTRVSNPFDAYVISKLNARGEGTKDYVDRASYRVLRTERIAAARTTVTTYDDFRSTLGHTQAWHRHSEDGSPDDATDYHVTAIDEAVAPEDVKIPGGKPFVEFPAGSASIKLPATMAVDGKFLVRVTIAGRGLDFVLDTGAAGIIINEDVARELGLKIYATHSNPFNAGRFSESETIVPEMRVGDLTMHDVAISTIPDIGMELPKAYKAVGLLGFDFIADLSLKLDYENGAVTAMAFGSFTPPADPRTIALPIRIGTGQPETDVTVDGALGERFVLDTGGVGGLLIFDYFARRHPEALVDEGGRPDENVYFRGAGGEFKADPIQLKSVLIGQVNFANFVAYRVRGTSYSSNQDGVIGPAFFRYFTLYTDYGNSELYLTPNDVGGAIMKKQ